MTEVPISPKFASFRRPTWKETQHKLERKALQLKKQDEPMEVE